jgi:hypothetical protein
MTKILRMTLFVLVTVAMFLLLVPFILVLLAGIFAGGLIALVVVLMGLPVSMLYDLSEKLND